MGRYRLSLDNFTADVVRSAEGSSDTVWAGLSVALDGIQLRVWPAGIGDYGEGGPYPFPAQFYIEFETRSPDQIVAFNYQLQNLGGGSDQDRINALNAVSNGLVSTAASLLGNIFQSSSALALAAGQAASASAPATAAAAAASTTTAAAGTAAAAGTTTSTVASAGAGTAAAGAAVGLWAAGVALALPVILKAIEVFTGGCDGPLVLDQIAIPADALAERSLLGQPVVMDYPGVSSQSGCGANSYYRVQWTIRAAESNHLRGQLMLRAPHHAELYWCDAYGAIANSWRDDYMHAGQWSYPAATIDQLPPTSARQLVVSASRYTNRVDVFWAGADGSLMTAFQDVGIDNGSWSKPSAIVGAGSLDSNSAIAAVSSYSSRLDVFWTDLNSSIRHGWLDTTKGDVWNTGDPLIAQPGEAKAKTPLIVEAQAATHLDLFWLGPAAIMWSFVDLTTQSPQWSMPTAISRTPGATSPVALSPSPGSLLLFWLDGGGYLWGTIWAIAVGWSVPFQLQGRRLAPSVLNPIQALAGSPLAGAMRRSGQTDTSGRLWEFVDLFLIDASTNSLTNLEYRWFFYSAIDFQNPQVRTISAPGVVSTADGSFLLASCRVDQHQDAYVPSAPQPVTFDTNMTVVWCAGDGSIQSSQFQGAGVDWGTLEGSGSDWSTPLQVAPFGTMFPLTVGGHPVSEPV